MLRVQVQAYARSNGVCIAVEDAGAGLRKMPPPVDEVMCCKLDIMAVDARVLQRVTVYLPASCKLLLVTVWQLRAIRMVDRAAGESGSSFFLSAVVNECATQRVPAVSLCNNEQVRRFHSACKHTVRLHGRH